jgi:hypothetical protein
MRQQRAEQQARLGAWYASLSARDQRLLADRLSAGLRAAFAAVSANADAEGTHGPAPNLIHSHRHRHQDGTWRSELHDHKDDEHQAHVTAAAAKHIRFERGQVRQVPQDKAARRRAAAEAYERANARHAAEIGLVMRPGVAYAACLDLFETYGPAE